MSDYRGRTCLICGSPLHHENSCRVNQGEMIATQSGESVKLMTVDSKSQLELDRLRQEVESLKCDIEDQKPYKKILSEIDRAFECDHVSHGPDDAQEVLRHVKKTIAENAQLRQENQRLVSELASFRTNVWAIRYAEEVARLSSEVESLTTRHAERVEEKRELFDDLNRHKDCLEVARVALSRVMDWCLMESPNFEIDADSVGEAVHEINVVLGSASKPPINQLLEKK